MPETSLRQSKKTSCAEGSPEATRLEACCRMAAERHPEALAIWDGTAAVTFARLEQRACCMAGELQARGARPGQIVALERARSSEQLVALLAILKTGAAVLPVDPSYPVAFREAMLTDSQAVLKVDASFPAGGPDSLSPPPTDDKGLCYVLYTSGSTGRPKGVAMPHRSLVNLIRWQDEVLPVQPGLRVLQFAPLSFDVSFQEIFSTWAGAGTLVLCSEETRRDPAALWKWISEQRINRVFLPYVALQMLAEAAPEKLPESLRDVVTAGEALRITPQIRDLFSRLPQARLHNHYGPTETHVCTAWTLPGAPEHWPLLPPIGTAVQNHLLSIRDEQGQPAMEGELFVGGAGLAQGYLHRPELTAERFIHLDGQRYYRTGDRVRQQPGGILEYLGRADDQIKVRGFRIEPGEVEAHLSQHSAVSECAVTAHDQRLVAYWVGHPAQPESLRTHLQARLPAHAVPSIFLQIEKMPLTPSGKINRRALPAPPTSATSSQEGGTLSDQIAAIWAEVLGSTDLDRAANFFDLGGTSLNAVAAQQLLSSRLKREMPVTLLFQYPTVNSLAEHLCAAEEGSLGRKIAARATAQRAALLRRRTAGARE